MTASHSKISIAIDGYSSCGKSTIAKQIAAKLHYKYIDTGAMYRAVTLYALRNNLIANNEVNIDSLIAQLNEVNIDFKFNKETQKSDVFLNEENVERYIRTMEINSFVSPVSAIKEVRDKMVKIQQKLGKGRGVVMDGRDIGTVVLPEAELKIFMTADINVRTMRRVNELREMGMEVTPDEVMKNLAERDFYDSNRKENPLRKADDAIILDNTNLSKHEQLDFILIKIDETTKKLAF